MAAFLGFLKRNILALVLLICLVLSIGIIVADNRAESREKKKSERYALLSKRIFTEKQNDIILNLSSLRSELRDYLKEVDAPYSIYIEYLPSGTSVRLGETNEFIGASLLKIPVVMDLYKAVELGRLNLDQEVEIDQQALSSEFGNLYQTGAGNSITLRKAAELTLSESDNTAARLIFEQTSRVLDFREESLNFLDVELQEESQNGRSISLISARSYSSFLKCLYLSCYLNFDNSQDVLDLLSKTRFDNWLVSGISDPNIRVAHKIGLFSKEVASDCGIVYIPKRPYSICVMFKSTDTKVNQYFTDISKSTYNFFANQ